MLLKPMGKFLSPYVYVLISFKILYAVIRNVGHMSLFFLVGGLWGGDVVGDCGDVVGGLWGRRVGTPRPPTVCATVSWYIASGFTVNEFGKKTG